MKTAYKIYLIALSWIAMMGSAAASASAAAPQQSETINVYKMIKEHGGPVIYPLFVISIVTVVLIFFFFITIRRNRVVSDRFMGNAEILIRKKDYLGLIAQCNNSGESVARVTEKAVEFMTRNTGIPFKDVREVAEAEGSRQAGLLTGRVSYLPDLGNIATMLGLLGTVIGMIGAFLSISKGNIDGVQQMKVAEKVYPALITTGIGLSINIIAMIFYAIFRGKVQKYIAELEAASTHLLALLSAEYDRSMQRNEQCPPSGRSYFNTSDFDGIDDGFAMPERQGSEGNRELGNKHPEKLKPIEGI